MARGVEWRGAGGPHNAAASLSTLARSATYQQHMHVKCRRDMQDTVGLGRAEMELNLVEAARLVLQLGKLVFRVPAHILAGRLEREGNAVFWW